MVFFEAFHYTLAAICWLIFVSHLLYSCKEDKPVPPTVPQVIEIKNKAADDSLAYIILSQKNEIAELKKKLKPTAPTKTTAAIAKAQTTAKENNCTEVVEQLEDVRQEYTAYVTAVDEQMQTQGKIIVAQDSIINTSYAQTDLQKSKFKELTTSYNELGQKLSKTEKDLAKSERRRKGAKTLNFDFCKSV